MRLTGCVGEPALGLLLFFVFSGWVSDVPVRRSCRGIP